MKNNTKGSALIISMFVTIIIIIIAIYLLEKIVPFAQDIKGVENGNISYYRANTALNEALLSMSGGNPSLEPSGNTLSNGSGMIYSVTANGITLPQLGKGNSEYDPNWSILAPGKPVQLLLKNNTPIDWSLSYFIFRVPNLGVPQVLSGGTTPIINWTLSASGESLQASGSQIRASAINSTNISLNTTPGMTLAGINSTFGSFYTTKCVSPIVCTLKLSLINPLLLTTGEVVPYIEYQAIFDEPIPLQTAVIETQGYAGGFRKNITHFIQQMTTNEALDFTVFQ
ncbi:hypothetical protein AUK10_00255 [Candidatus Gracilibacteria bacterium CG2_30_37_12]|nr:MAG: hypothetical protein AUK10_00255 [Candidatus Gracilibacteria bacterium CG2_30_37_12]